MKLLLDENLSYRLVLGNCSNAQVLQALITSRERLDALVASGQAGVIELG